MKQFDVGKCEGQRLSSPSIVLDKVTPFDRTPTVNTLIDEFRELARVWSHRQAVLDSTHGTTYGRLMEKADELSARLIEVAGAHHEPIAFLASHGQPTLLALMSVWAAGKVAVPLDLHSNRGALRERWEHSCSRVMICDNESLAVAQEICGSSAIVVDIEGRTHHDRSVRTKPRGTAWLSRSDAATIVYTSGSTGNPRGVVHTHECLHTNAAAHIQGLQLGQSDRGLWLAKVSTISGLTDTLRILLSGGTLLPYDLATSGLLGLQDLLATSAPTIVHFVPTVFRRLVGQVAESECRRLLRSVRILHLGGESVTRRDFELFQQLLPRDCQLLHNLGCTEIPSFRRSLFSHDSQISGELLPLEQEVAHKTVTLIDMANGQRVIIPGREGEIVVRSRYAAIGYWRDDRATANSFRSLPGGEIEYFTGDVGCWDDRGALTHLGRRDQQIKIMGRRVDLAHLEAELIQLPMIDEVVALAIHAPEMTRLSVFYTSVSGLQPEQLRQMNLRSCDVQILDLVAVQEIPTLPNGKVDRLRLSALGCTRSEDQGPTRDHRLTETQTRLSAIWQKTLGVGIVALNDDFFKLGGDSLLAADLLVRVDREFRRRLTLGELAAHSTLRHLADYLDDRKGQVRQRRCLTVLLEGSESILVVGGFEAARPLVEELQRSDRRSNRANEHCSASVLPDAAKSEFGVSVLIRPSVRDLRFRFPSIERSVDRYCSELADSTVPWHSTIVGYSYGGLLAFALACRLWQQWTPARTVMLIEPSVPRRGWSGELNRRGHHEELEPAFLTRNETCGGPVAPGSPRPAETDDAKIVRHHPVNTRPHRRDLLARLSRWRNWVYPARYARLLVKSMIGRPQNRKESWELFRPIIRFNRRMYIAPKYPGDLILVGSNAYLSATAAIWQGCVSTELKTVALCQDLDHYAFSRPEWDSVWMSALIDRMRGPGITPQ